MARRKSSGPRRRERVKIGGPFTTVDGRTTCTLRPIWLGPGRAIRLNCCRGFIRIGSRACCRQIWSPRWRQSMATCGTRSRSCWNARGRLISRTRWRSRCCGTWT
uniref:(northern house mosquito) hypothetical protein n=1 Tax=Culex pipiens TaxID=7175 RepID=A0A8D8CQK0_CULPI